MVYAFPSGRQVEEQIQSRRSAPPDYAAMDLPTLEAAVRQLEYDKLVITEQIADDWTAGNPRGEDWRRSAGTAQNHIVAKLHLANTELGRRRKKTQPTEARLAAAAANEAKTALKAEAKAAHEAQRDAALARAQEREAKTKEIEAQTKALQAAKALEHQQHNQAWEMRNARRNQMLVDAAKALMSQEEFTALVVLAKEMNPNAPEWGIKAKSDGG